jgi:hypothetical protein
VGLGVDHDEDHGGLLGFDLLDRAREIALFGWEFLCDGSRGWAPLATCWRLRRLPASPRATDGASG